LKVLQYLNNAQYRHDLSPSATLDFLKEELGIKYSYNEDYDLYVLNYDQINSPKDHKIVKECRSLVLEYTDEFKVVSRAFDRFFNYGEKKPPFKFDKLEAHEKMDGSLVTLFHHKGQWLYRTKSMIMPELEINGWDRTWADLIQLSLGNILKVVPGEDYIFEVTGQENRVVVRYPEGRKATLLAIRKEDGTYLPNDCVDILAKVNGWNRPRRYKFETIEDCNNAAAALPDLEEGYVMYRNGVPVCKVKNPAYVAAHHLRGEGLNPKRCLQLVCLGEVDEYISVFPEDAELLKPYVGLLDNVLVNISRLFVINRTNNKEQKEFAMKVKDLPESSCLFAMRAKGITAHTAFFNLNEKAQHRLLEQYL